MSVTPLSAVRDRDIGRVPVPAHCRQVVPPRFLREWMGRFCRELDLRLDAPIVVKQRGSLRTITVFRVVTYTVDASRRRVDCTLHCHDNSVPTKKIPVDLWRPIHSNYWMQWFLADMGLWQPSPQQDLFAEERRACYLWLADSAFRLLQRDPRFLALRMDGVPRALGLVPELVNISLRARIDLRARPLPSSLYTRIWRHKAKFRQLARENPQLLPVLNASLQSPAASAISGDPVAALKAWFKEEGVHDAAWRYLCRHGARLFRTLWDLTPHIQPLRIASLYLLRLQQAGLPPPPSPTLLRAWAAEADLYDELYLEGNWTPELSMVLAIALREASRRKAGSSYPRFVDEFTEVMAWARSDEPRLDKNQRRAGWPLLVRKALERHFAPVGREPRNTWTSLVDGFDFGSWQVVPLTDDVMLHDEAIFMRNCINLYTLDAVANKVRLFSVRRRETGKRVANVELRYASKDSLWIVMQVAAKANQSAPLGIEIVVHEVERRYNEAQTGYPMPDLPEDVSLKPGPPAEVIANLLEGLA